MLFILICLCMYVCMVECMRCGTVGVWQVTGSNTLSYCKGRVPYLVSGMKIYPSVQEEGDCASIAIEGSPMRTLSPSYNRDTQTDRQTQVSDTGTHRQTVHAKGPSHSPSTIRQENRHICMYVCKYVL
jgi:hypothetical protein